MNKEIRDKSGNLVAYNLSKYDKIKFEVTMARYDERMSRMESHLEDHKTKLDKISNEQTSLVKFIHDLMGNLCAEVKKIDPLEKRINSAEKITKPLKWFFYIIIILIPLSFTVLQILERFEQK